MDLIRCPSCGQWVTPDAAGCPFCGAALAKSPPAAPGPQHRPSPQPLIESAAALRRTSAQCWAMMWLAFIVQIFCSIGIAQGDTDSSLAASDEAMSLVWLVSALVLSFCLTRLADAAEFDGKRKFVVFAAAFLIPIAGMFIGRSIRKRLRRMARELDAKAAQMQAA